MDALANLSLWPALGAFGLAAGLVWSAGTRLSGYIAALADRLHLAQGLAGMLFLGGITSLPEIATAGSAGLTGAPGLAVNNLLGTSSVNMVLLVIADAVARRSALEAAVKTPTPIIQGILGMLLMTATAMLALAGDREVGNLGVGAGSIGLFLFCAAAVYIASRYEKAPGWTTIDDAAGGSEAGDAPAADAEQGVVALVLKTAVAAAVILAAGFVLAQAGDVIARESGLGVGLVGLVLVGFATSLPELSSVFAAVKIKRFELAIGDILGTNIFNVAVLFVVDIAAPGPPVLGGAGVFEATAALLSVLLTGVFVVAMLARRPQRLVGIGYGAWVVLLVYAAGLALLMTLPQAAGDGG